MLLAGLSRPKSTVLLALLCCACICHGWSQAGIIIENADFEKMDPTEKRPARWEYIPPENGDGFLTAGA